MKLINNIIILCSIWNDTKNGNRYFSSKIILINPEGKKKVLFLPCQLGNEDHCLSESFREIVEKIINPAAASGLGEEVKRSSVNSLPNINIYCRKKGIDLDFFSWNCKKSEMIKEEV